MNKTLLKVFLCCLFCVLIEPALTQEIGLNGRNAIFATGFLKTDSECLDDYTLCLDEIDAKISFPALSACIWKNMPSDSVVLEKIGRSSAQVTQELNALNCEYSIFGFMKSVECRISIGENTFKEFESFTQYEADYYLSETTKEYEKYGINVREVGFYDTPHTRVLKIESVVAVYGQRNYSISYFSTHRDSMISIQMITNKKDGFTDDEKDILDEIVMTLRYENKQTDSSLVKEVFSIPDTLYSAKLKIPFLWSQSTELEDMFGTKYIEFRPYGYSDSVLSYQYMDLYQQRIDGGIKVESREKIFEDPQSVHEYYKANGLNQNSSRIIESGYETIRDVEYYFEERVIVSEFNNNIPIISSVAQYCDRRTGVMHVYTFLTSTAEEWERLAPTVRRSIESAEYPKN